MHVKYKRCLNAHIFWVFLLGKYRPKMIGKQDRVKQNSECKISTFKCRSCISDEI